MQKAEIEKAYKDQKHFWALIKNTLREISVRTPSPQNNGMTIIKSCLTQALNQLEANHQIFQFVASYIVFHDNTCVNCDSNENDHLLKQLNRPIHESEIREQIDMAKRGKSPGADGILNELLKLAKEKLIPILKMLFNKISDHSVFPSSWRLGIITSILEISRQITEVYLF